MIDLLPDTEQQALIDAAHGFLARRSPVARLREITAAGIGYDPDVWTECAGQGWYGLGLPESAGGVGCTLVEEALLCRELGRFLAPGPILPTMLGARLAVAAGASDVAAGIVSGASVVGLGEVRPGSAGVLVWDAGPVDLLLVVDALADTAVLAEAPANLRDAAQPSIDPAHRMVTLAGGSPSSAVAACDAAELLMRGAVLVAAMQSGIAEAERDMGARYAIDREQFGRPIGAFQAVKHRAADTAIRAEAAWSQTAVAALRVAAGEAGAQFQASSAKVVATDAAIRNGRDTIQNHGAIGFTAEHDAHLFLKRAHVLDHMLGDTRTHLSIVLDAEVTA